MPRWSLKLALFPPRPRWWRLIGRQQALLYPLALFICALAAPASAAAPLWPLDQWPAPPASRPAPPPSLAQPRPASDPSAATDPATRLKNEVQRLAAELMASIDEASSERGLLDQGLAVATFVELKKLDRSSSFGRLIAEQLLTEFQRRGLRVVEARTTSTMLVAPRHGEHFLSREPELLQPGVTAGAVLTGTYTPTPQGVFVNGRIIAAEDGTVLASAVLTLPRDALIDFLLADRSSAGRSNRQPIYVKELP